MVSTKKERISWYFYDWANSAFSTSVITVFLGPYITGITRNAADAQGFVFILGIPVYYASYFAYLIALSVIIQLLILPVVGAIADNSSSKKSMLGFFAYAGAFATMCMYFLQGNNYLFGGALFVVANACFGASAVMYNSFLNDIAEPDKRDAVSSTGWAIGYLGGGINLALNLILFINHDKFGISTVDAVRISLCSAGLWWALFTIIPMVFLKQRNKVGSGAISSGIRKSIKQLFKTISEAKKYPQTLILLFAYLFYNDGVQAVIALSAQFGNQELNISMTSLTTLILLIQFVAFAGAIIFNFSAKKIGTKNSIILSLILWIFVIFYSFAILKTETEFYFIGMMIGLIMGGTQALSRSIFSRAIPAGKEAEYFSLYEISEKGTSWMGPLVFGLSLQLTESYRIAILSLVLFFIIGLFLLLKYKETKSEAVTSN